LKAVMKKTKSTNENKEPNNLIGKEVKVDNIDEYLVLN